jgi:hypothetical protein
MMNAATWLVALTALGVQYSYRTGLDRQPEYVLQIEPEVLPALAAGEQIYSEIPSDVGPFARLCLIILPPDGTPAKHTATAEEQFRQLLVSSARYAARDRGALASDLPPAILWPGRGTGAPEAHYGVSTGWQPDNLGQQQFLVQLDPVLLGTLSSGDELYVPIDPAAGRIARFIVKVGKENLPRISQPQVTVGSGRPMPTDPRDGRSNPPVAGGGGNWPTNAAATDSVAAGRFGSAPRENASRELSQGQTGWPAAGAGGRFSANDPALARSGEQPASASAPVAGDVIPRGYVPPVGAPVGPSGPEMWAPPTATVGVPSAYGPSGPPASGGDVSPRVYGPAAGDPRAGGYPDLRTAALPGAASPSPGASPAVVPPTGGAPSGQALPGLTSASAGNAAAGLPVGGGAPAATAAGGAFCCL